MAINNSLHITPSNINLVISAIENDLREMILLHLDIQKASEELLGKELWEKCVERQKQDIGFVDNQLKELLLYADFADLYQVLNSCKDDLPKLMVKHLKSITPQLEKLVAVRNRIAHNRPLYYDDCERTEAIAHNLKNSQEAVWNHVRSTVAILENEQSLKDMRRLHNLPMPDYEETGFIGRKKQVDDLKKHCLQSPYPVITVFGDGGVGKSALALKTAYDILQSADCPFETIIWTSSKTTQLTPQEIKNIENAIRSSISMFQNVSDYLAPQGSTNPFEEVLSYLSAFKILLILDNLETILDDQIRQFLGNLPTGSKVLITSRIGVGAYEVPFRLQPMDEGESIQLLRALADTRQVSELVKMPNSRLEGYCRRMKNSPLFIKWFVSAVQTGKRPEEILDKRDLFLEFCMSNVYEYLEENSRRVLTSLLCIPGKHSQAELAFLNEMEAKDLESAIHQLQTTTMFTISSSPRDSSFESKYELSELARDYLSKHHPVRFEDEKRLKRKRQQLIAATEEMNASQESDPYSFYSIARRSQSDMIVAKYLWDALGCAKRRDFKEADDCVDKARNLAPEYFEVYRVEAAIKVQQDNYSAARTAYEAAIELNPNSAPLRYWYGGFLMRYQNELEEALKEFQEAAKIDPVSMDIQMEIARTYLYLRKFSEAKVYIDSILKQENVLKAVMRRKLHDLNLQVFIRKADYLISQRDKGGAFVELEKLQIAYQNTPPQFIDHRIKEKLEKAKSMIEACSSIMGDGAGKIRADNLRQWFYIEIMPSRIDDATFEVHKRLQGRVVRVVEGRNFGFIRSDNRGEFFFRRHSLAKSTDWDRVQEGMKVFFWPTNVVDGPTPSAINVIFDEND